MLCAHEYLSIYVHIYKHTHTQIYTRPICKGQWPRMAPPSSFPRSSVSAAAYYRNLALALTFPPYSNFADCLPGSP